MTQSRVGARPSACGLTLTQRQGLTLVLMSTPSAIETRALRHSYGAVPILSGLDLAVPSGSVYALLGPNGAGKTTTVRILATLLRATGGDAFVGGHDVRRDPQSVRSLIGVTGQFSAIDELMTGRQQLGLIADLVRVPKTERRLRIDELVDLFGLGEAVDTKAATYSGGQKRKLDLAMTLIASPAVVFLDEPTTGLDPRSRRDLWEVVRRRVDAGTTVLLTTQYLDEADALADRVGVLDGGVLVAEGTPSELKSSVGGSLDDVFLHLTDKLSDNEESR